MTEPERRSDRTILLETKQILDPQDRLNWSPDLPMGHCQSKPAPA